MKRAVEEAHLRVLNGTNETAKRWLLEYLRHRDEPKPMPVLPLRRGLFERRQREEAAKLKGSSSVGTGPLEADFESEEFQCHDERWEQS